LIAQSNQSTNKDTLSAHTRKVKFAERVAKSLLWTAAAVTLGTLLVIIGYIVFRGLVSDLRIQYDVLPAGVDILTTGKAGHDGAIIVVNENVRVDDLTIKDLAELFNGERDNWGGISEQDIDVRLFGHTDGSNVRNEFEQLVFADQIEYAQGAVFVDRDLQVIENVARTDGAIGYISAENRSMLKGSNAKEVEIRHISIAVNPSVLEVRDGARLHYLTGEQIRDIFSGRVTNWSEVGGNNLPITVAVFSPGSKINNEFEQILMTPEDTVTEHAAVLETAAEMSSFLALTPGAAGFVYYNDALLNEIPLVSIQRRETKLNLTPSFIFEEPKRAGRVGGISTIILNTFLMICLTLLMAGPIGVAAAIYLTEYTRRSLIFEVIRFGTETLAGIPSIVFGLFGFILFVMYFNIGIGLLSGTLTITFMILPTIIRASEEAIKSVPKSIREGSLALGATKWQTITRVVLPVAVPGILTGLILGIGRAVGETAALLFTMGSDYRLANDLLSSARVMSVHLYILVREGISFERAFATGTILIIIILLISFITNKLIGRMARMHG